ncbi:MAG: hypothetical protein JNM17_06690 [Archangium sp.]|nr:hypothetical protein [Archangium sp.]
MKRCAKCGRSDVQFNRHPKRRDGLQANCKACQAAYTKAHYQRASGPYKERAKAMRARLVEIANAAKAKACADCAHHYPPYVMEFDHVGGTKLGEVSWFRTMGSEKRLRAEIAKCEVVCANCHRERTHQRSVALRSK